MLQQNETKTKLDKTSYPKNRRYVHRVVELLHKKNLLSVKGYQYTSHIVYNVLNGKYQDLNVDIALKEVMLEEKKIEEKKLKKVKDLEAQIA